MHMHLCATGSPGAEWRFCVPGHLWKCGQSFFFFSLAEGARLFDQEELAMWDPTTSLGRPARATPSANGAVGQMPLVQAGGLS